MNNPLLYTDPSGYHWLQKLNFWSDKVGASPSLLFGQAAYNRGFNWLQGSGGYQLKSAVISFFSAWCGWGAWACNAGGQAGLAKAYGASDHDAIKTGVIAGASTAMMQWAGYQGDADSGQRYMAHAAAGCGSSVVAGGGSSGCARGAAAAVVGKWVSNNTGDWGTIGSGVATITAGGVTSQMMGGTFANGATTAAYAYLFNAASTPGFWNGPLVNWVAISESMTQLASRVNVFLTVMSLAADTPNSMADSSTKCNVRNAC
jgi:hypothetical protein